MITDLTITREISRDGFRVVVRPATYRLGLYKTILAEQARKEKQDALPTGREMTSEELVIAVGAVMSWPCLIAATVEHEGFDHWPLTPDELLDTLPEAFVTEWETAVYALNPQWVAKPPEDTGPKKATNG